MMLWQKKIPTLLAVLLLLIGVVVTSILVQEKVIVFQNAAPPDNPQDVRITNMSDTAFTVTYTTTAHVVGTITLQSSNSSPQVILDERDQQSGIPKPYTLHSISAKNLSPNTEYLFKITSNTTTYLDGDKLFSLTTPASITTNPTEQTPLAGKILLPDGTKPVEALVFVTTANGQMLSTLLNSAGLYILPLNTMRTKDFSAPVTFTSDSTLQILATNGSLTSQVITGINDINPIAQITLSQNYDFTLQTTPLASNSATVNFPVLSFTQGNLQASPEIITPKNNESFTDQKPQFQGTAAPNSTVTISIHSTNAITTQVTSDANGNWSYRPNTPLSPGPHTITVTTPDKYGILHTLTQSFTVYAAGSQVNQSATPSATLAPTTPTATPPIQITPTITPLVGSISATPTTAVVITTRPTLPPTGSNSVAIAGVAGVATTAIGILLFFVTSGATL